ncbi:hypothetical protein A3A95_00670 [Candidatus Nomurabacteria bacterium RIFCSPLOWO2_01_FULL_39_18]|uniref:PPM-type phosphatase domain-containing protein n=1 Tax=Candidatus Nomurabacteria bacterium RIFCSPHIGHO2_01_FULL_40_24b TaxID=1801739 RepID=A0A1F6V829_9BACT|nr:MAG: hypothetical protein A2647_01590 [Candidatus Nomurabacteria bacterium RIFCSPHIGHO2_01_FULL_40_24b]OGI89803.1 MAG: hypothetical protein A3A95_00670 [Candidatus Nomurabacteria bacterium RIFCSPLOWO2_01_FULL_39_18]
MGESINQKTPQGPGGVNPGSGTENKELILNSAFRTEKKESHPVNQDTVLFDPQNGVFGVFDGMGGHEAGEVASRIARDTAHKYIIDKYSPNMSLDEVKETMKQALVGANSIVSADNKVHSERGKNMGTTATVLKIHTDALGTVWGIIGHVGDSRLYISDGHGFDQITKDDDSMGSIEDADQAFRIREILDNVEDPKVLNDNPIAKFHYGFRHKVVKALGLEESIEPAIEVVRINKGSKIVITCDGINVNLVMPEIEKIISKNATAESIANGLVGEAVKASKSGAFRSHKDDLSVVALVCK